MEETTKSRIFLNHALKLVNAPLGVVERLELIARIIAEYLAVDDVAIFLREPGSDTLILRVSLGLDPIAIGNIQVPIGKGVTGMVAKTREYIASSNVLEDPRNLYNVYAEDEKYPSMLSFPIVSDEDLIGVVNIRSRKKRDFTEQEAEELDLFTASIAGSIRNAQLHEQLEYRSNLLELSIKIAGSITSTLDLDQILNDFAVEIADGFSIQGVLIQLVDKEGDITHTSSHGLKSNFIKNFPQEVAQSCMLTGEPRIRRIEAEKSPSLRPADDSWNICLPLMSRDRTIGVIGLFGLDNDSNDPRGLFLSLGVDVLLHLAQLTALAIDNAITHSRLRKLADQDKQRLNEINVIHSRMSAVLDSITNGIIAMDGAGMIQDFNEVARKSLGFEETDKGRRGIDTVITYKTPVSAIIQSGGEPTNRVMTFKTPMDKFAAVVTIRSFKNASGEQLGSVISFRPMEETVKLLSRFNSQRPRYTFEDIIGNSTTLVETVRLAKLSARSNSNVLVTGESGTGKELFSQAIHNESPVADGPFIPVNCAAIPKDLIESELFGYAEGAFTGARKGGYIGKFEQATGGTIFLDEVGDMPLDTQVKLLRVLQDKVIQRVGSEHLIPINTRVITATNRDLKTAITTGEFREELYWRLNVINIHIPPLRDRKVDIPEFISFFIAKFAKSSGREVTDIEPNALKKLIDYSWQGNIRELENAIEHAILMSQSTIITWNDLSPSLRERVMEEKHEEKGVGGIELARRDRENSSRKLYREVILQTQGDVEKAAKHLGMSRATLYRRLKKYGITDDVSKIRHDINFDTID